MPLHLNIFTPGRDQPTGRITSLPGNEGSMTTMNYGGKGPALLFVRCNDKDDGFTVHVSHQAYTNSKLVMDNQVRMTTVTRETDMECVTEQGVGGTFRMELLKEDGRALTIVVIEHFLFQ